MSIRQGDVILVPVKEIPKSRDVGHLTLAYGESTGHHHTVYGNATFFRPDDMPAGGYLEVQETSELRHQEHDTVTIPPGLYVVGVQVEDKAEAIERVAD